MDFSMHCGFMKNAYLSKAYFGYFFGKNVPFETASLHRHGKRRDLRDPGSRIYSRIVEEFSKYCQHIPIKTTKQICYCHNIRLYYVIKRLRKVRMLLF